MATNEQKWIISLISGILFYVIALPDTYQCITSPIFEDTIGIRLEKNGRPTTFGVVIHAIVFLLIVRLMMNRD